MKHVATAMVLLAVMFMGSSVCAGVMRVLADIVNGLGWQDQIVVWMITGGLSLACSLLFLYGTMQYANKLLNRGYKNVTSR